MRKTAGLFATLFLMLAGVFAAGGNGDADRSTALSQLASIRASMPLAFEDEPLAIVVNKSNPIENVSFGELRNFFLGERTQWPNGQRVTIVMRDRTPERETVLREIYRMSEADFSRYFLHASFTGQTPTPPRQLSSPVGVRRFVVNVPGAIGYLRASEVDGSVKPLKLDGHAPGESGYKLRINLR